MLSAHTSPLSPHYGDKLESNNNKKQHYIPLLRVRFVFIRVLLSVLLYVAVLVIG